MSQKPSHSRKKPVMPERPYVGVGVIVVKNNQVLLMRRKHPHGDGTWSTPGGHLEYGESPQECAVRQAWEGTEITIADVVFRAITNDMFEVEKKHSVTIWMEGIYVSGDPTIQAAQAMSAVGWFSWDALPEPLFLPFENLLTGRCDPAPWDFSHDDTSDSEGN